MATKTTPGVEYCHSRKCQNPGRCAKNCNPSAEPWQAWVYDAKYIDPKTGSKGKKIRRRFATHAAAKGWRANATKQVSDRRLRAVAPVTLRQEVADWIEGARSGAILNKRQEPYKPGVIRNYELALRLRVLPALGDKRLSALDFADLLDLQERLQGDGCSPSVIRNTFVPLQAIFRRARRRGAIAVNPAVDLELPTAAARERAATPAQARDLLATFADAERALWAAAFFSGLRRGELRGLRVSDVDLAANTIRVERGWDDQAGPVAPKSRAGRRVLFLAAELRPHVVPLVDGRAPDELVFGKGELPFDARATARKAARAWDAIDKAAAAAAEERGEEPPAPLERYTLHEARHSFSTWLDHAGVSSDRGDRYMGHSSGTVASRYRHLLPAQRDADRAAFDAYVDAGTSAKVVPLAAARVA